MPFLPSNRQRQTTEDNDELQQLIDNIYMAGIKSGLRVNCSKTEVQCIGRKQLQMKVNLDNQELSQCDNFLHV